MLWDGQLNSWKHMHCVRAARSTACVGGDRQQGQPAHAVASQLQLCPLWVSSIRLGTLSGSTLSKSLAINAGCCN